MDLHDNATYKGSSSGTQGSYPGLTYVDNHSRLDRIHPLVKLVLLFSFSVTVFAIFSIPGQGFLFGLLLVSYALAGLGGTFFLRKLRFIFVFGFFIFLVQALAVKEGVLLWHLSWGPVYLSLWSQGLQGGLKMMMRFINIVGSSYLFVATTDPNKLAYALMQVGLPYRFGFALITALRFIPVFHLELEQVRNAQMAKGIELEGLSPRNLLRAVRYLFVPLVISALSRVDNLTISMEGRAFGLYPVRTYMSSQALSTKDKLAILVTPLFFLWTYLIFQ